MASLGGDNNTNLSHSCSSSTTSINGVETMQLWQINCRKSGVATLDINSKVDEFYSTNKKNKLFNSLCICIQEPQFKYKRMIDLNAGLDQFSIYVAGEMTRALIATPKECNLMMVESLSTPDIAVCTKKSPGEKNLIIVSMYMDITKPVINDYINKIIDFRRRTDSDLIICVDSNAHSTLWGSREGNARGRELEQYLFQQDLVVINQGGIPTFESSLGSSVIDLTICNDRFATKISEWQVRIGEIQSDHRLISFNVDYKSSNNRTRCFRFDKADWKKFAECMTKADSKAKSYKMWNKVRVENEYIKLRWDIVGSMQKSMPYLPVTRNNYEARFWNDDLNKLRRDLRKAFKVMISEKTNETKSIYATKRYEYKKAVKAAKLSHKCEMIDNISNTKDMSNLIRMAQGRENRSLGMLQRNDGTDCTTITDTLAHLMETHFPGSRTVDEKGWRSKHKRNNWQSQHQPLKEIFCEMISHTKVREAFSKFGDKKAAGPDQIKPIVLKKLPDSTIKRIVMLYRASLTVEYMPTDWLLSKTIFIPKPGKENYKKAKSFRPISLSSFLLKGLERIVSWHLEETTLRANPLCQWQHGFRKDKSTESAITEVINYIESAKCQGEYCVAVLLDIQGAFDNIKADRAKEALINHGFQTWFVNWYGSFLSKRYAETELNGETIVSELDRGTPQGDVISTTVWNVSYDPMLRDINIKTVCKGTGFADDSIVLMKGKFLIDVIREVQKALNIAIEWGNRNGLQFNASKTEALIFTDKRKFSTNISLYMDGIPLQFTKEAKYLGVILDERLNWKSHMEQKINVAKRKLMTLKSVINSVCGPSNKLLEWAYRGVVIPSLAYGSIAFYQRLDQIGISQKLRQLNRLAILLLTRGVHRSTPTRAMEILMDYPPLHLLLKKEALQGATRMRKTTTYWDGIGTGKKRSTILILAKDLGNDWDKAWNMETTHKLIQYGRISKHDSWNIESFDAKAVIYTSQKKGYWTGYYAIALGNQPPLEEITSYGHELKGYQVYLYTLLRAIVRIRQITRRITNMILLSKNCYLQLINKNETRNTLLQHVWRELGSLNLEICLRANRNNYLIDLYNRNSVKGSPEGPGYPQFPLKEIKANLLGSLHRQWEEEWKNYKEANQSKFWLPNVIIPTGLKSLNKRIIGILIQTITGHGPYRYHLQKSVEEGKEFDSTCNLCHQTEQTARHLILECPTLSEERAKFRVQGPNYSVTDIDCILNRLRDFILNNDILNELFQLSSAE